jgi:hypothetical protein
MHFLAIDTAEDIGQYQIPDLPYACFYQEVIRLLQNPANRLLSYYGFKEGERLRFMCAIMNSQHQRILVASYSLLQEPGILLAAISQHHIAARAFERQISSSLGITFANLPTDNPEQPVAKKITRGFSVN